MNFKLKTKLYAGLGFLAFLVLLLRGSGLIFIHTLAGNSKAIIQNNNRTVFYAEKMEQALARLQTLELSQGKSGISNDDSQIRRAKKQLLDNLSFQQQNITEDGEIDLTNDLKNAVDDYLDLYEELQQHPGSSQQSLIKQYETIQKTLGKIAEINLDAINRKNDRAQHTASNVIFYMTIIGAISMLLAMGLLFRYPAYIIHPVRELIDRIKQIANKNYDQKLNFNTADEFEELAQAFNTMAAKLKEYDTSNMAKLKNEKERIEAIINHMPEAVIGLDKEMHILFVNAKAEELIGISEENLAGRLAPDIALDNHFMSNLVQDIGDDSKQGDHGHEKPTLLKVGGGDRLIYYSKEIIPVVKTYAKQENNQQTGTIITLKNVTHFQEINEAKTNFIAIVSHELKTPIASINMGLRLLEDERVSPLNAEQYDLVKKICEDTNRMKRTTKELLDLTRIETGNIHLNTQRIPPLDLIEYAFETMNSQAQRKEINLQIECDQNLPPVKADIQKTVWVLVNLISNAIRYTPAAGNITLKAQKELGSVKFLVIDNGTGIPPEYLDKIFQKYFQIQSDNDENGTGLGLAIAKEFINAQGGEIGVNSEVGKGSTFYFTLPKESSR